MACKHKFYDELDLKRLDYEPTTLIVGTFNPGWDIIDNPAKWFYGRVKRNRFWDVLPKLYGEESLLHATPELWQEFCKRHRIAITDLIKSIKDADPENEEHISHFKNFPDSKIVKYFSDFEYVSIRNLKRNKEIKHVYITRKFDKGFWKSRVEDFMLNSEIKPTYLLTPSGNARYKSGEYKSLYPNRKFGLSEIILEEWKKVWHTLK